MVLGSVTLRATHNLSQWEKGFIDGLDGDVLGSFMGSVLGPVLFWWQSYTIMMCCRLCALEPLLKGANRF